MHTCFCLIGDSIISNEIVALPQLNDVKVIFYFIMVHIATCSTASSYCPILALILQ